MLEKDKKFEDRLAGDYMLKVMTGAEAFRAVRLVIGIWAEQDKGNPDTFLQWLNQCIETNTVCEMEWEQAIKEMIEEREEYGDELHPTRFTGGEGTLKPC